LRQGINEYVNKEGPMPTCHDLKKGEVYICGDCGLEVQVTRECDCEDSESECACTTQPGACVFTCCGEEMKKKT
jgi:hypothetical protein